MPDTPQINRRGPPIDTSSLPTEVPDSVRNDVANAQSSTGRAVISQMRLETIDGKYVTTMEYDSDLSSREKSDIIAMLAEQTPNRDSIIGVDSDSGYVVRIEHT